MKILYDPKTGDLLHEDGTIVKPPITPKWLLVILWPLTFLLGIIFRKETK